MNGFKSLIDIMSSFQLTFNSQNLANYVPSSFHGIVPFGRKCPHGLHNGHCRLGIIATLFIVALTHSPLGELVAVLIYKFQIDLETNQALNKPTLLEVMAWCHQAPSHYLKHCWPRTPTPCCVIMQALVNFSATLAAILSKTHLLFNSFRTTSNWYYTYAHLCNVMTATYN